MDETSDCNVSDIIEGGASKSQSECISNQPTANGKLPHPSTEKATPPLSDRSDGDSTDDSLIDGSSTNDVSHLLPTPAQRTQKGADNSPSCPLVCTLSASSLSSPHSPRSSTCDRDTCSIHHPPHQQQQHSTKQKKVSSDKSHASVKTDAAHIKEVAGDDCCVHCLLACLFCEMLSMCSALGECLACGVGGALCCDAEACCCCCLEAAGEAACTEEACQAVLDCGILEDCCGSSDCLEICLECCSICFPS